MITDKLIQSISSRLKVTNTLEESTGSVHLVTNISLGSKEIYSHKLDLEPLVQYMISRIPDISSPTSRDK